MYYRTLSNVEPQREILRTLSPEGERVSANFGGCDADRAQCAEERSAIVTGGYFVDPVCIRGSRGYSQDYGRPPRCLREASEVRGGARQGGPSAGPKRGSASGLRAESRG